MMFIYENNNLTLAVYNLFRARYTKLPNMCYDILNKFRLFL